jgi:hypothetical protein
VPVREPMNRCDEESTRRTLDGKAIYVRFTWSNVTSPAPHFEQAYSEDGGRTWEVNWITEQTRLDGAPSKSR